MRTLTALVLLVSAVGVSHASIPLWLDKAEVYNGWYAKWDDQSLARMRGIPFVVGVPADKAMIAKAHKAGVRVLIYATFYQAPPDQTYQNANISEHPDWPMIVEDGSEALSVFAENKGDDHRPGWRAVCRNSPGYWKYAIEYTRSLTELGVDGIFVDNVFEDNVDCEGPRFGRHKHIYPDKDETQVYYEFFKALRAEIRKFGPDKILVANTVGPHPQYADVCDAEMLESYICTWAADNRWQDQARILGLSKEWKPVVDSGCKVLALSYLGHTKNPVREDAFYCYAWARISGFMWADWFTGGSAAADLFRVHLGKPVGDMETREGCYLRRFERGVVVVSGESGGATVTLDSKGRPRLYDVFAGRNLKPSASGKYDIKLKAGQGRVFLFQPVWRYAR